MCHRGKISFNVEAFSLICKKTSFFICLNLRRRKKNVDGRLISSEVFLLILCPVKKKVAQLSCNEMLPGAKLNSNRNRKEKMFSLRVTRGSFWLRAEFFIL